MKRLLGFILVAVMSLSATAIAQEKSSSQWFFLVQAARGSSSSSVTLTVVGPFISESQCNEIRNELTSPPQGQRAASVDYRSKCWKGPNTF